MARIYYVYILANRTFRLEVGVTNNLTRRLGEHRTGIRSIFAHRYNIHRLVYMGSTYDVKTAIRRETQIKGWRREKNIALMEAMNPRWDDLSSGLSKTEKGKA